MDVLPALVRLIWTAMFILGCLASGLVIFFTIFRVARHQRNNIYFVRLLAIFEFSSGLFGWCSMPRTIPTNSTLSFISYGICNAVGPQFCYICTISMLQCLVLAGSVVPITFCIRYVSLRWSPPNFRFLVVMACGLIAINLFTVAAMISIYSPTESWKFLVDLGKIEEETYASYEVYGPNDLNSWQFKLFMTLLFPMGFFSSSASFTFRYLILRFLKQSGAAKMSTSTLAMQRKFIRMLTIQAAIPIVGLVPSVIYTLLRLGVTSHPAFQSATLLFDSAFPFLSGATTLLFLSDYRRLILNQLCIKSWQTTTTGYSTNGNSKV